MVYIGRNNHRGHWPMINRTMLSLHVSSLSILKSDQRPFNKPTHITQQQPQHQEVIFCFTLGIVIIFL